MERVNKTSISVLGLEIAAKNIAIESILCDVIDNEINTDLVESVITIAQKLENNINTVMASDIDNFLQYRPYLIACCHAIKAMCARVICADGDTGETLEATISIARNQRNDIENLMVAISEL